MLMRVKLRGSGTELDPFNVPFPSYEMVTEPNAQGRCIIRIPDRVAPEDIDDPNTPLRPIINGQPVLIGLRPAQRLKWLAKMHRAYDRIKDRIDIDVLE